MPNQYVNKVVFGDQTLLDLTTDTVTPSVLMEGYTAHDKSGALIIGTIIAPPTFTVTFNQDESVASVTCNKTYAECKNNSDTRYAQLQLAYYDDFTEEYVGDVYNNRPTLNYISYLFYYRNIPQFLITYNSDGTIEFEESAPNVYSETITENGTYTPGNGQLYNEVIVNVQGGGSSWQTVFEGSVTTTSEHSASIQGLDYNELSNSIKVTFNGVEYSCEKNADDSFGATYDESTQTYDWSEYPFAIYPNSNGTSGYIDTETAGTYTLKIEEPQSGQPTLQTKSVSYTPSETAQSGTVTADSGYDGLSSVAVSVGAISSSYVGSGITRRSSTDLTVSGATVTAPSGYYSASASKSVASGTAGTPTATKGTVSNHSVSVTPSVTNTTGYITGGTKSGTAVSVSASELVSGTLNVTSAGTKDVTNYASASIPSGTEGTPTATKGTVTNHSVSVTPSVTNTSGFISGGTKSGTAVTVSASELVSGSETKTANGTYDVTNLSELVVALEFSTIYTGSGNPSSSTGSNGDIYLKVVN